MACVFLILLAFLSFSSVFADIPDNVLSSDSYCEINHPGDNHLLNAVFSETDSVISCFGYTISGDDTHFWILTIDYSGAILNRQTIPSPENYNADEDNDFLLKLDNGNSLRTGNSSQDEQTTGLTVFLNRQGKELWRRNDWYNDHSSFSSAVLTPDNNFLLAGWTGNEITPGVMETNVLLAIVNYDGSRIVGTEILAEGNQRTYRALVTSSGQIIVVGTVIQSGENDADLFFLKLNISELL
ncbi:MAG: hypothetical protein K8S62_08155 [Candidatus Sabulitectum sp.]|nr:hypothetical protein [Candidatus Sabulitectum sp.]